MSSRHIAVAAVAVLVVASLGISGCARKAPLAANTQPVTVPVATATPTPEPSATPTPPAVAGVTSPVSGSTERTALLDAVRKKFGTTAQYYVYQLFAEGNTAIGDVNKVTGDGNRTFVAWAKNGSTWSVVWSAPYGSSKANKAGAVAALPTFSSGLLGKIAWQLATPPVTSEKSMLASLNLNSKKWAAVTMDGQGAPYKVTSVKVAKDANGTWWGVVIVQPSPNAGNQFEALTYWAKFSNGAWSGQVQDPEPPAPSTYFPASVLSKLGL